MAENATMNEYLKATALTFPWHELYVGDAEEAREFYSGALGWETEEMPHPDMGSYKMLKANGSAIAGVMGTNDSQEMSEVPPHWAVYIGVDDVDARLAKCQELGGKLIHGPMDIPTVGRMALVQDPQGAHFWLYKGAS